jgi:hypothetical protein
MGFLTRWGDKLGLYRAVPASPPDPSEAVTKKTTTLRELQAQLPDVSPAVFEKAPALTPAADAPLPPPKARAPRPLSYEFEKIYTAARVYPPAHGWTIERVVKLLRTDQFKSMDDETIKKSLLGMLAAENVPAEDIVKDAIARDKAIDAFEIHLHGKLEERHKQLQQKIESNRREIEALKAALGDLERQIGDLAATSDQEQIDLRNWVDTIKRAKEEELARAVAFLTAEPVISIGSAKPEAAPAPAAPSPDGAAGKPAGGGEEGKKRDTT